MNTAFSKSGEYLLGIKRAEPTFLSAATQFPEYTLSFLPEGEGTYYADFGAFPFAGPALLFSTPLQAIHIEQKKPANFTVLQFHSDFYCIEYHRAEVSCNGLLFNNIYLDPVIHFSQEEAKLFVQWLDQLEEELHQPFPSEIVLRAYLQLLLAKSSSIKIKSLADQQERLERDELMEQFRHLLDLHYLTLHKPHDYAALLAMSPNNFTRRCTRYFKKSPSQLIQERLILEAKKQLHLTRKSIKEIAYALKFNDEFYFSRFFKKFTHVSPQTFRDKTGISIVADLSME